MDPLTPFESESPQDLVAEEDGAFMAAVRGAMGRRAALYGLGRGEAGGPRGPDGKLRDPGSTGISIPFASLPANLYVAGPSYRVEFDRAVG